MSKKRAIPQHDKATDTHTQRIYWDNEWQEYNVQVRCKANGKRVASYHTDDIGDAVSTGIRELAASTASNATVEVEV